MAKNRNAGASRQAPEIFNGGIVTPRLGEVWPGQGGVYAGVIKGEAGQPDYCLVVAITGDTVAKGATVRGKWGPQQQIATAQSDYDGLANTRAMAQAGSALAKAALAVEFGGFKDFYIPARQEARVVYANARELFAKEWHWTSTQDAGYSDWAWSQDFGNGGQDGSHKSNELPALLVRRIPVIR